MGLSRTRHWTRYHRVLNRAQWSSLAVSRVLLGLLVAAFAPAGPVVVGVDETIERRWGGQIAAKGLYREVLLRCAGVSKLTGGRGQETGGRCENPVTLQCECHAGVDGMLCECSAT